MKGPTIGLLYGVFAPISTHTPGSAPTYQNGIVFGEMMSANVSEEHASAALYADNARIANRNDMTGATISLGVASLKNGAEKVMLGYKEADGDVLRQKSVSAPYGGCGYIKMEEDLDKGEVSYNCVWWYKTQFARSSEDANTKTESVDYQTPTLDGNAMGLDVDGDGVTFRDIKDFTTEEAAKAWINGLAGISA